MHPCAWPLLASSARRGCAPRSSTRCRRLVSQAGSKAPDCVIADIRIPEISGLELPALLAKRGIRLPVIFVTAYDTDENRVEARRVRAAGFFRKPVDGQACSMRSPGRWGERRCVRRGITDRLRSGAQRESELKRLLMFRVGRIPYRRILVTFKRRRRNKTEVSLPCKHSNSTPP